MKSMRYARLRRNPAKLTHFSFLTQTFGLGPTIGLYNILSLSVASAYAEKHIRERNTERDSQYEMKAVVIYPAMHELMIKSTWSSQFLYTVNCTL